MPCKEEEMWKKVCESWYSVAPSIIKGLSIPMPSRIADLIKAKGDPKKYRLYDAGVYVVVFSFKCIESMLLCFSLEFI